MTASTEKRQFYILNSHHICFHRLDYKLAITSSVSHCNCISKLLSTHSCGHTVFASGFCELYLESNQSYHLIANIHRQIYMNQKYKCMRFVSFLLCNFVTVTVIFFPINLFNVLRQYTNRSMASNTNRTIIRVCKQ